MSKTYTIVGAEKVTEQPTLVSWPQASKDVIAEGTEQMSVSDGYHTMDELYEHRYTLYVALAQRVQLDEMVISKTWKSKKNSDGSQWDGWFLLGIGKDPGSQITYHLPMKLWDDCWFADELEVGIWDGHTSVDVLERLKTIL